MPFHVGGHKPKPPGYVFQYRLWHRLPVAGIGTPLFLSGLFRLSHGHFIGMNYLHQPVYTTSSVGIGALTIMGALLPSNWLSDVKKRP